MPDDKNDLTGQEIRPRYITRSISAEIVILLKKALQEEP